MLYQHKHCQPGLKGTVTGWLLDFQNSIGRTQADGGTQLQACVILQRRRRMTSKAALWVTGPLRARRVEHQAIRIILRLWDLVEFSLLNFKLSWNKWLSSFHFLLMGMRMRMTILHFSLHCYVGCRYHVLGSQVHIWRRLLLQDGSYSKSHPHLI